MSFMSMALTIDGEEVEELPDEDLPEIEEPIEENETKRNVPLEYYYATTNTTNQLLAVVDEDSLSYDYEVLLTQIDSNKAPNAPDELLCNEVPWPEIVSFKGVKEEDGYNKVYTSVITEVYPNLDDSAENIEDTEWAFFIGHSFYQISSSYYVSDTDYGFENIVVNSDYTNEIIYSSYVYFDYKNNENIYASTGMSYSYNESNEKVRDMYGYTGSRKNGELASSVYQNTSEEMDEFRNYIINAYNKMNLKCEELVIDNIDKLETNQARTKATNILNLEFNYDELRAWKNKINGIIEVKDPEYDYYKVHEYRDGIYTKYHTVIEGSSFEFPYPFDMTNFDGWYTDNTFTTKYEFPLTVTSDINLFGRYVTPEPPITEQYHTVYFIIDGEEYLKTHFKDGTIIVEHTYVPSSKDNYVFDGWYIDEECREKFDFNTPIMSEISLYGRYIS